MPQRQWHALVVGVDRYPAFPLNQPSKPGLYELWVKLAKITGCDAADAIAEPASPRPANFVVDVK
ncbi:MAG: hypothetical protein ABI983_02560 [Acidobacteriota bacterium]